MAPVISSPGRLPILCVLALVISLLACKNGQLKEGITLESLNNGDAFDEIFADDKSKKPDAKTNQAFANGEGFFSMPSGWVLSSADDESGVYKLEHEQFESASIIISYDQLQKEEDGRLDELKVLHDAVITRLPSSLTVQQSEMTRHQGEPRYHTMLRGKPSEDSVEMIVSGYTVALVQDAFTVFAAYPVEQRTLASDIEGLIYSLKPYTPLTVEEEEEPAAEPDVPADEVETKPEAPQS